MAGEVQLKLQASLDLAFLRSQLASLGSLAKGYNLPIVAKLDTKQVDAAIRKVSKEIRININDSQLDGLAKRLGSVKQQLDTLKTQDRKIEIGVTGKASITQKDARKIRTDIYRGVMQEGGKILLPVGLQPISQAAVNAFKADLRKKLGSISVNVGTTAGGATTPGRSAGFQAARQSISTLGVEQLRSRAFSSLGAESRSAQQISQWLDTIVEQGLKGPAKTKQLNAIRDFLADALAQAAGRGVEARMGGGQNPLQKNLDTFARGLFRMLGMDPVQLRAERQARLAPPAINWPAQVPQRNIPIGPSSTGRALPQGAIPGMLPGTSYVSQKRLVGDVLSPSLKEALRGAANAFVDNVRRELNSAVRQVSVRDLGVTIRGALPPGATPPSVPMLPAAGGSGGYFGGGRRPGGGFVPPGGFPSDGIQGPRSPMGGPRTNLPGGYVAGGQMARALGGADQFLRQTRVPLAGAIENLGSEFAEATKQVLLYGTAYKGLAFFMDLPRQTLNAAAALQTFRNQLNAVTGSAANANISFAFIDNLADRFAVPLESIRQGFVRMYASMEPAGFGMNEIQGLFTGISKAAATFGMSRDQVDRVTYAFSQMASKGQIMAEELRGQLGDVLPGSLALFARAAQMSIPEFTKAMEDGRFSGEAMRVVLNNVAILLNQDFAKGAEGAAKTLQGALNQMQNSLQRLYEAFEPLVNEVAREVFPLISGAISEATKAVQAFAASMGGSSAQAAQLTGVGRQIYDIMRQLAEIGKAAISVITSLGPALGVMGRVVLFVAEQIARLVNTPLGSALANWLSLTILLTAAMRTLALTGVLLLGRQMAMLVRQLALVAAGLRTTIVLSASARLGLIGLGATAVIAAIAAVGASLDNTNRKLAEMAGRARQTRDELMDMATAGSVAAITERLTEAETRAQSLKRSRDILSALAAGGPQKVSQADFERLKRAGLASGLALGPGGVLQRGAGGVPLVGASPSLTRDQARANLEAADLAWKEALSEAGNAQEALKTAVDVASRQQQELAPIPPGAAKGSEAPGRQAANQADQALRDAQQRALALADFENNLGKISFERELQLSDEAFDHRKNALDAIHDYEVSGLNDIQARQKKFAKDLEDIQLQRIETIRKAQVEAAQAAVQVQASANTAMAAGAPTTAATPVGTRPAPSLTRGSIFQGFRVTSVPGESRAYRGGTHEGYDFATPIGTAISYMVGGIVKRIDKVGKGNIGKMVEVQLENGVIGFSGHLSEVLVEVGQRFTAGQVIAKTGDTGVGAAHLHQESAPHAYRTGRAADSLAYLQLGKGRPSRSSVAMAKTTQAETYDLMEAKAKESVARDLERLKVQNALQLAFLKTASIIEANLNSIFPVEQQKLDLELSRLRANLQLQEAPQEVIDYEEAQTRAQMEGALAQQALNDKLADARSRLAEYEKATKGSTQVSKEADLAIKMLRTDIAAYEKGLEDLAPKQLQYNMLLLQSTIEAIKNADALKAQQEAIQLIDGNVESATDSYKNFLKEIAKGGSAKEALKKFQDALADQVLTVFFDVAFKPVEDFLKDSLKELFDLPNEEAKRQEMLAKLESQLAEQKRITAATEQTAVNTGQGSPSAPAQQAQSRMTDMPGLGTVPSNVLFPMGGMGAEVVNAPMAIDPLAFEGASNAIQGLNESIYGMQFSLPSLGDSLKGISDTVYQVSEETKKEGATFGESLGKATSAIGIAAGTIMGIAAGISQIKEGSTSGILGGIGSILLSVGGAIGGFGKLFGANGGIASGGWKPFPVRPFANGGLVTGPTLGLVGEGKYNEAIVPLPDGRSIPVQLQGEDIRDKMGSSMGGRAATPMLSMSFQSTVINGVEYVDRAQLEAAMAETRRMAAREGASRGANLAIDRLANSPSSRRRIGIR